jgi:hypothetical protein
LCRHNITVPAVVNAVVGYTQLNCVWPASKIPLLQVPQQKLAAVAAAVGRMHVKDDDDCRSCDCVDLTFDSCYIAAGLGRAHAQDDGGPARGVIVFIYM